ncbi:MAG: GDP-mannose 4,6-dehydratase [Candidatus Omnitrophica bacterium]|nr:GDP-mannose 4,6-dehydratase [Candidatus Omnitrophota bacterium]
MKFLITGGAGFIGSHLAEALLNQKHEVFIIDNLSTGRLSNLDHIINNKKLHCCIDDILNKSVLNNLVKKSDIVVHIAAAVGVKYIIDNPLLSLETNLVGTQNVLYSANEYKKLVFLASTSEIYGKNSKELLHEDDDRILGTTRISRWGYSTSKAVDECLALAYSREKKLPIIIGRFFNTVGPRQSERYGMVIPRFIKQALLGHPITVYGDGRQSRCFSYVLDIVDAIIGLINCPKAKSEIFNIGNTEEITIEKLAQKIKAIVKSDSDIVYMPYNKAYEEGFEDMRKRKPDISKLKKYINFKPKYNLEAILKNTIECFKA